MLQAPAQAATPQATVRSQIAQLIMANLYLGIAEGRTISMKRCT